MQSVKIATSTLVLAIAGSVLFLGLASAEAPSKASASASGTQADGHDTVASEAELQQLAGRAADRCVHSGPSRKLCGWTISGRLIRPGGSPEDARAEVVKMICELPVRATNDARGACRAHPQGDRTAKEAGDGLPHVSSRPPRTDRQEVWRRLSSARTVAELSHFVGAMPSSCRVQLKNDYQRCEWRLSEQQGLLAALAPADGAGVLRCALPLDGSDRDPTSCGVVRID